VSAQSQTLAATLDGPLAKALAAEFTVAELQSNETAFLRRDEAGEGELWSRFVGHLLDAIGVVRH
jgi:hypothetical protein